MKRLIVLVALFPGLAFSSSWIKGKVEASKKCSKDEYMVWVALPTKDKEKKPELVFHLQVPLKGTFNFQVLPGDYILEASSSGNCKVSQKISMKDNDTYETTLTVE